MKYHIFQAEKACGEATPKTRGYFINAVFWLVRTSAPSRDLPPDYGNWNTTHRRFCSWRDKKLIEGISADHLIADRGYDSNEIVNLVESQGIKAVIPSKK